jgi:hypothetical protein
MLRELESSESVAEALARLAAQYDVPPATLENDLCELCFDLRDRGLIELSESDGRGVPRGDTDDPR